MYKKIIIERFGQPRPIELANGDRYDSTATIYSPDGIKLYKHPYVNTDPSRGATGGILAEGQAIAGILGKRLSGQPAFWLYPARLLGRINDKSELTPDDTILKSLIPNPNHGGLYQGNWYMIHWGGRNTDGSRGCITLHPYHGQRFFTFFSPGESVIVELIRNPDAIAPGFYPKEVNDAN